MRVGEPGGGRPDHLDPGGRHRGERAHRLLCCLHLLSGDGLPAGHDRALLVEERDVRLGERRNVDEGGGADAAAVEDDLFRLREQHLEQVVIAGLFGARVDVLGPHVLDVGADGVCVDTDAAQELALDLRVHPPAVVVGQVENALAHDEAAVAPYFVDPAHVHGDRACFPAVGVFLVPAQRRWQFSPREGIGGELAAVAGDDALDGEGAAPGGGLAGVVHGVVAVVGALVAFLSGEGGELLGGGGFTVVAAHEFVGVGLGDGPRRIGTAVRVVLHDAVRHGASLLVFGRGDCGRSQRHDRSGGFLVPVLGPHRDERPPTPRPAEAARVAARRVRLTRIGQRRVPGAVDLSAWLT